MTCSCKPVKPSRRRRQSYLQTTQLHPLIYDIENSQIQDVNKHKFHSTQHNLNRKRNAPQKHWWGFLIFHHRFEFCDQHSQLLAITPSKPWQIENPKSQIENSVQNKHFNKHLVDDFLRIDAKHNQKMKIPQQGADENWSTFKNGCTGYTVLEEKTMDFNGFQWRICVVEGGIF